MHSDAMRMTDMHVDVPYMCARTDGDYDYGARAHDDDDDDVDDNVAYVHLDDDSGASDDGAHFSFMMRMHV